MQAIWSFLRLFRKTVNMNENEFKSDKDVRLCNKLDKLILFSITNKNCKRLYDQSNAWRVSKIVYKKTDEWYIEWQRVTTKRQRVTSNDNEWHRVTTNDYEWQRVVQRVIKSNSKWQKVTANGNKRQWVRAVVQRMKTVQYTSKNGWLPSFQWQFQFHFQWHYYLKGWMAAIRVVK